MKTLCSVVLYVLCSFSISALCGCDESPPVTPATNNGNAKTSPPSGSPLKVPVTTNTPDEPDFQGITSAWAGADFVELSWDPAGDSNHPSELIEYRIYIADRSGKQDFEKPPYQTTERGETHARLENLTTGKTLFFVVRAFDHHGHEDSNDVELAATPNPVRYVNAALATELATETQVEGDGTTPEKACRNFTELLDSTISLIGVNVHVATGEYTGQIFVFEGMMLYGGFDPTFTRRDTQELPTTLRTQNQSKLVIAPPSERHLYCGLDGFLLRGNPDGDSTERVGEIGIAATDCRIQLSNLEIRDFISTGLELSSEDPEQPLEGAMLRCQVFDNLGEGIRFEGYLDYRVAYSEIRGNRNEGIEVRLSSYNGEKSKIEFEYCHISENESPGLDVRLSTDKEQPGGRIRVDLSGCVFEKNKDIGANIDLRFSAADGVDFRTRIEGNAFLANAREGLHVDLDAPGDVRVANNKFVGNAVGLILSGDAPSALCRVLNDSYQQQLGNAIEVAGQAQLWIRQSEFVGNKNAAVMAFPCRWIDACGCTFRGNGAKSNFFRLCHSITTTKEIGSIEGDGLISVESTDAEPSGADAGPASMLDLDLSRCDIGTRGGPAAAKPGTYAKRTRPIELTHVVPAPGSIVDQLSWTLHFSDEVSSLVARLLVAGEPLDVRTEFLGDRVRVSPGQLSAQQHARLRTVGTEMTLRLLPDPLTEDRTYPKIQAWKIELPYVVGKRLHAPTRIDQIPSFGSFEVSNNASLHRFPLKREIGPIWVRVTPRAKRRLDELTLRIVDSANESAAETLLSAERFGPSWVLKIDPSLSSTPEIWVQGRVGESFAPLPYAISLHAVRPLP